MTAIRIVIADDHHLVREGIRQVLQAGEEFEVVGQAANGAEALRLVETLAPDVLVLDVSMPEQSGIEVTSALRDRGSSVRVLMLSVHDHPQYVIEAVRAGARGYLRKDTEPAELRRAIRAIAKGESFFSPSVAKHLSAAIQGDVEENTAPRRLAALTPREREVLRGIADGRTNKEIAVALGLSSRTVESYRESLMRKLGIYTVAELTRLALEAERRDP
jgi:two-component system, NarL family, nitrate/nitrite response regulator NarL